MIQSTMILVVINPVVEIIRKSLFCNKNTRPGFESGRVLLFWKSLEFPEFSSADFNSTYKLAISLSCCNAASRRALNIVKDIGPT